ncbi:MAG: histidine kinase [Bacteroidia bacterium]|nr:histidine kinase [Bacteroidia bacterium]
MIRFFIIIVFLILFYELKAQEDITTLKKVVSTTKNDSVKLEAYWLLAKSYRPFNQAISRQYIDTIQTSINEYKKTNKKLRHYHLLYKANSLTTLANIELINDNLDESIKINLRCAKIYEQLNDERLLSVSLSNVGAIFVISGKLRDAVMYLKKSMIITRDIYNKYPDNTAMQISMAESFVNLGAAYSKLSNTDSVSRVAYADTSINFYENALHLYLKNKDENGIAFCYTGMVTGYRMKKDFKRALFYGDKSLKIFRRLGDEAEMSQTYINLSDIYFDTRNFNKVLRYADSVEMICLRHNLYENLLYIYETKMLSYEILKDVKNQLTYFKKFRKLKDSLNLINNAVSIEELKTQYETEKKEKEIFRLNKDNKIQDLQLDKESETKNRLIILIISIMLVLLLLALLIFFLMRTVAERKTAYVKLQEKNIEIQNQSEKLSDQAKILSRYQSQMSTGFIFDALGSIKGLVVNDKTDKAIQQLQSFSKLMRETLNNSEKEIITLETEISYLKTYLEFERKRLDKKIEFVLALPEDIDEILLPPMMLQPLIENIIKLTSDKKIDVCRIDLFISAKKEVLKVKMNYHIILDADDTAIYKIERTLDMIRYRIEVLFNTLKKEIKPDYFITKSESELALGHEVEFCLPLIYKY